MFLMMCTGSVFPQRSEPILEFRIGVPREARPSVFFFEFEVLLLVVLNIKLNFPNFTPCSLHQPPKLTLGLPI